MSNHHDKPPSPSNATVPSGIGWRHFILFLCILCFCLLSNMLHVFIDTPSLRSHASAAVDIIFQQEASPTLIGGFNTARLDNFTACLIIKTAAYTGPEPFFQRAFGGFRVDLQASEGDNAWRTFCTYVSGEESPTGGLSYSRYWHGYILPLRILLSLTTFTNIQMLFYGIVFLLIVSLIRNLVYLHHDMLLPGLCIALFVMMPAALGICIQYVPVTLITLISTLLLLCFYNYIDNFPGLPFFFGIIGLATCYYDLLTFPTVTLSFPLVIIIRFLTEQKKDRALKTVILCVFAWGIGFAGMWILKFLINAVLFGTYNAFNVLQQIKLRLSSQSNGVSFSRTEAFSLNVRMLTDKTVYRLLFFVIALIESVRVVLSIKRKQIQIHPSVFLYCIPFLISVIWLFMTSNHIYDHAYYTYRNLAGCFFSGIVFIDSVFPITCKKPDSQAGQPIILPIKQ